MMRRRLAANKGFTLIEIMVVVIIIGLLTAFAVPAYLKSVEVAKADDAVALLKMVGTTNRMFSMDNSNKWAKGALDNSANALTCTVAAATTDLPGRLIGCRYLAAQDWDNKGYTIYACDGASTSEACGQGVAGTKWVAAAERKDSGTASTTISPYNAWGYAVDVNGRVYNYGGAPAPVGL